MSRTALLPAEYSMKKYCFFFRIKQSGSDVEQSSSSYSRGQECVELYVDLSYTHFWRGQGQIYLRTCMVHMQQVSYIDLILSGRFFYTKRASDTSATNIVAEDFSRLRRDIWSGR